MQKLDTHTGEKGSRQHTYGGSLLAGAVSVMLVSATALLGAEKAPPAPPGNTNSAQVSAELAAVEAELLRQINAPLLFVKRHSYTGIHIYDTYYKWPPGGGGIYVLENPQALKAEWKIRPVIDATTPGTLGNGVYTHPELSWDATKLLFCYKGEPAGSTSVYEIGVDGTGLRRISDPAPTCEDYKGRDRGQHDVAPAYLPDGRIIFLSTRPSGLVPCNNTGVAILHVMNADGSGMHPISVNNVNEFDPSILSDGRVLFGRWEYVDKNALTIQSLWTVHPDGTEETAFFANNMVLPEAILDARPVPDSHLIVGTFAKHNAPPRGSIAFVDPHLGKNGTAGITNLEHPSDPTKDTGESCEPWALSDEVVLFSGRPPGKQRNAVEIMDRKGHRFVVLADTNICLHSPMLVKARPTPSILPATTRPQARTGRFLVQDIYQGLDDVKRGEVKWLRVLEETSRVSATHPGKNPYNQTFLVSAALAFSVKNFLGVVPVDASGSAYFEAPSGRALYLQALDADGRLVQSMRTFVQAAPGTTRSCIGCHEHKFATAQTRGRLAHALERQPDRLQSESWGSGYMDYPSRVQPILDKHCVSCHGGEEGLAAGLDLTGGWTEHFNISYENLASRRETQLIAYLIAGIDCMNGTAYWSSQMFQPRKHGSGAAPLAEVLVSGHEGRIAQMSRTERDLLLAWIDSNGLYHGSWDYSEHGCAIKDWESTKKGLITQMEAAGCMRCHGTTNGISYFANDWFNLREPELSRVLRAPLSAGAPGLGLGLCRDTKADPKRQRVVLLRDGYAHAVQPVAKFPKQPMPRLDTNLPAVASFEGTNDAHYQKMLATIRRGRVLALASPRIDMPGAEPVGGACRQFQAPPVPSTAPVLFVKVDSDAVVHLSWVSSAETIGLEAEVHRGARPNFVADENTWLASTPVTRYADKKAPPGRQYYSVRWVDGDQRGPAACIGVDVPEPTTPQAPVALVATAASCAVRLEWSAAPSTAGCSYHVYRRGPGDSQFTRVTSQSVGVPWYTDAGLEREMIYTYHVRAVSRRDLESTPSSEANAAPRIVREPVFITEIATNASGRLYDGDPVPGKPHGNARLGQGELDLAKGGHLTFPHRNEFELSQPLTVECWVWMDQAGKSPVLVSCGEWRGAGWFLQRLGNQWRWHVGGIDCDGGSPATNQWVHLAGIYDGTKARLFENGKQVTEVDCQPNTAPWPGELHIGQYSAAPGGDFQVNGRISGVKIYHRPLASTELLAAAATRPGTTAVSQ